MGARFKLPLDDFDRAAVLLALETAAGLLGDDAVAERARALRDAAGRRDGGAGRQRAHARGALRPPSRPLELSAAERDGIWAVETERGTVQAIPRDTGESVLFMHELTYEEGTEDVPMLRWLLVASDWSGARLGLAELPGGDGAFAACAVPALDLQPQAVAFGARAGPAARRRLRRQDGARVSAEMVITIAFYALLVFGYFYAGRQGLARARASSTATTRPPSGRSASRCGAGAARAMPVLGPRRR